MTDSRKITSNRREGKSDFANIVQRIKSMLKPQPYLVALWSGR